MEENETTTAAAVPKLRPPRANRRALRMLREPIPAHNISKRPYVYCWECNYADKQEAGATCAQHRPRWCGTCRSTISPAHEHEDYVGHAEVTDRFLEADLLWNWEAMATDERGLPVFDDQGGLWIWLTIGGVRRPGYGHANGKTGGAAVNEAVSNALKNSGMRFGTGLNQRAQTDLHTPVKTCPHCAKPTHTPDAKFCSSCGYELPVPKGCASCGKTGHGSDARFCSDCGYELLAAEAAGTEPEYARPDWIARVNSLLARKYGAHGHDRLRELSELLEREVTDVAKLSQAEARDVVRILSGSPTPLAPATPAPGPAPVVPDAPAAVPTPKAESAQASPAPEPSAAPPAPAARAKRGGPKPPARPAAAAPASGGISDAHARTITSLLDSRGVPQNDTRARLGIISGGLGRDIASLDELSAADAEILIRGLGSGYFSADPPPTETPVPDTEPEPEPDRTVFDGICAQITQAITEEDAFAIKVEIGKALTNDTITRAECAELSERLEKRGHRVGLAGGS